jgi:hypothetical protein
MPKKRTPPRTAAASEARRINMAGLTAIQSRIHCPDRAFDWWQRLTPRQKGAMIDRMFQGIKGEN